MSDALSQRRTTESANQGGRWEREMIEIKILDGRLTDAQHEGVLVMASRGKWHVYATPSGTMILSDYQYRRGIPDDTQRVAIVRVRCWRESC